MVDPQYVTSSGSTIAVDVASGTASSYTAIPMVPPQETPKNKFGLGETIFVIDGGKTYKSYNEFAKKLNVKNWKSDVTPNHNEMGMVLNCGWCDQNKCFIYLIGFKDGVEVLIGEQGISSKIKPPPEVKMEEQVFKIGEKVIILNGGHIYYSDKKLAEHLKLTRFKLEYNPSNIIGIITQIGKHYDTNSNRWIYVVEAKREGVTVELLILRGGLIKTNDLYENLPYRVGQKVKVKEQLEQSLFNAVGINDEILNTRGKEFQIAEIIPNLNYTLNTDRNFLMHHGWLEPVGKILKKDEPMSVVWPETKSLKDLIEHKKRKGNKYPQKTYPLVDKVYKSPYGDSIPKVLISNKLYKELNNVFTMFMNYWGYSMEASHYNSLPVCFLLGKKDEIVSKAVAFQKGKFIRIMSGCGQMPTLNPEEIAINTAKLAEKGYIPCGIARVGSFDVNQEYQRGDSMSQIQQFGPGFFILSFGRTGIKIQSPRNYDIVTNSYEVVKGKGGYALDLK